MEYAVPNDFSRCLCLWLFLSIFPTTSQQLLGTRRLITNFLFSRRGNIVVYHNNGRKWHRLCHDVWPNYVSIYTLRHCLFCLQAGHHDKFQHQCHSMMWFLPFYLPSLNHLTRWQLTIKSKNEQISIHLETK